MSGAAAWTRLNRQAECRRRALRVAEIASLYRRGYSRRETARDGSTVSVRRRDIPSRSVAASWICAIKSGQRWRPHRIRTFARSCSRPATCSPTLDIVTHINGESIPWHTGGLPDGVHPTHRGYMLIGIHAVLIERFG